MALSQLDIEDLFRIDQNWLLQINFVDNKSMLEDIFGNR